MSEHNSTAYSFYRCTEVSPTCPVKATTLGYFPTRGFSYFFAVSFGLAGAVTLGFGLWKKTWSYTLFITTGCMVELAGYAARTRLTDNPWNQDAFETQICAIVLAPTVVCISIYLTLKHITLSLAPELSRVRPRLYPFIFVPLDISCLVVQAIGGALAASGGYTKPDLVRDGNRAIIAGISLQVAVLLGFGAVSTDYFLRVRKWISSQEVNSAAVELWRDRKFRLFVFAVTGAYGAVLIRCIYRVAEMAGGWGNPIMQDEPSFIALEAFMVLIACVLLAMFPPGIYFPQMAERMAGNRSKSQATDTQASLAIQHEAQSMDKEASGSSPELKRLGRVK